MFPIVLGWPGNSQEVPVEPDIGYRNFTERIDHIATSEPSYITKLSSPAAQHFINLGIHPAQHFHYITAFSLPGAMPTLSHLHIGGASDLLGQMVLRPCHWQQL